MATKKAVLTKEEEQIVTLTTSEVGFAIVGRTPLIMNSMSAKVRGELLYPSKKKTAADKAQKMKHNPMQEFADSMYMAPDDFPTALYFPASALKKACMTAALEVGGVKKTEIGRLLWVEGDKLPIYGAPQFIMSVVRMADISRTPDVRTRAILPEWARAIKAAGHKLAQQAAIKHPQPYDHETEDLFAWFEGEKARRA